MKKNTLLFFLIISFIAYLLVQNVMILIKINQVIEQRITARATYGSTQLCINRPPRLNNSCIIRINQTDSYYCAVNATEPEGDPIFFISYFITNYTLFNISQEGVINFTANSSMVGNHTYVIQVSDLSLCGSSSDIAQYIAEIINENDPPILIMPIPNQTWDQDTSITPFDLDNYFYDPDGDPINYTWSFPTGISVLVNPEHEVTFTPNAGWYGTTYITFIAYDPYGLNATSNSVVLTVRSTSLPPQTQPPSRGGGGGGPSLPRCIPEWYCREWGVCMPEGYQKRECIDLKNCNSTWNMPDINRTCEFISTCYDGFKGPDEEGVDCGGVCPPCGNCYDGICNNEEDCTKGLTIMPDCGGPCKPCETGTLEKANVTRKHIEQPEVISPQTVMLTRLLLGILIAMLLIFAVYQMSPQIKKAYLLLTKKKKKHVTLAEKYQASILERLALIESKITSWSIDKLLHEFSNLSREYFKDLFELEFEFTYEELIKEIKERKIEKSTKNVLINFFNKSLEVEYSGIKISKFEFQAMINEFREIISITSTTGDIVVEEKELAVKPRTMTDTLFLLISNAETDLRKKDIIGAYKSYLKILETYHKLSNEEKKRVLDFVHRIYEEIKFEKDKVK